ncbi:Peroxisomal biogenesis factor 6, partial [Neolecta irregularis DAH-3]
ALPDHIPLSNFLLGTASITSISTAPLTRKIHLHLLQPQPAQLDDPERIVFANLATLAKIPCFSGDWVLLNSSAARIFAYPSLPHGIHTSPILHHNLGSPASTTIRHITPQIKTASQISLYRVSSPAHIDKSLENAFIQALKSYFESHHRILRQGDLFPILIDQVLARAFPDPEDLPSQITNPTTIAWYKVAAIPGIDYNAEALVDFSITKTVQIGSTCHRLPIVTYHKYLGLDRLPIPKHNSVLFNSSFARLRDLVDSSFSRLSCKSLSILLHGQRGVGKRSLIDCVSRDLGMNLLEVNCYEIIGESLVKTRAHLQVRFEWANQSAPCILLLTHIDALAKKSQTLEGEFGINTFFNECLAIKNTEFPLVLIGTSCDKDKIADELVDCFQHELYINAPSESERTEILSTLTESLALSPDVHLSTLAIRSAALVAADLVDVVSRAKFLAFSHMEKYGDDAQIAGILIASCDFEKAISEARRNYSDSIGAPRIPNVSWDDVGGLIYVKKDILDTIHLPLQNPHLFASGMKKRSGILLYGPPGTGKTLVAKAVATTFSLNFFSIKGPELLNMYIGESEANVRRVFQRARDAKPCVVFFDELDSIAPKRGNQGDSGGVMDRIVSQLLAELDGMSNSGDDSGVFIIGATNRPDLLDSALLRPGRFDKMLYLGVCSTHKQQLDILEALTRKFNLSPDLSLEKLAEKCPLNLTGADLYALCSDAILKSMSRMASLVDFKIKKDNIPSTTFFFEKVATKEDIRVVVGQEDFEEALKGLVPSVSEKELLHYKMIQQKFTNQSMTMSTEEPNHQQGTSTLTEESNHQQRMSTTTKPLHK